MTRANNGGAGARIKPPAGPPTPPEKPLPTDCCGSGCRVCVFDAYAAAFEAYQQALARWQQQQGASN